MFRLSRIRGKVSYATKAEHDFRRPREEFDPRAYANRAEWQLGEQLGVAEVLLSERIAWQIERHFGRYGEMLPAGEGHGGRPAAAHPLWRCAHDRLVGAGPGRERAAAGPEELVEEYARRVELLEQRHAEGPPEVDADAHSASGGAGRRARQARAPATSSRSAAPLGRRGRGRRARRTDRAARATAARPRSAPSASRGW